MYVKVLVSQKCELFSYTVYNANSRGYTDHCNSSLENWGIGRELWGLDYVWYYENDYEDDCAEDGWIWLVQRRSCVRMARSTVHQTVAYTGVYVCQWSSSVMGDVSVYRVRMRTCVASAPATSASSHARMASVFPSDGFVTETTTVETWVMSRLTAVRVASVKVTHIKSSLPGKISPANFNANL